MTGTPATATGDTPHLLHVFSTFVPAGPQVRTVELINDLGGQFRHSILSMDGRISAADGIAPQVSANVLESPPVAGSWSTIRRLRRVLVELQPNLLLTYNWGAFDIIVACDGHSRKSLLHHEDGFNADEVGRLKLRRTLARRTFLPRVHRVIVPSARLRDLATHTWKLQPQQVALVPNGIRASLFPPADGNPTLRSELGVGLETPVVGWVGHLRPVKNLPRLLRGVATQTAQVDTHLLIVGDGPERGALHELAAVLGLAARTHFVGHQVDVGPFLRAMDIFALSSDSEQMPISVLEAMATGLPIVATDVGDIGEMLPACQRSLLVSIDADDPSRELATRLDRLIAEPALRTDLGSANRRQVEDRYTFDRMRDAYLEIYRSTPLQHQPKRHG